MSKRKKIFLITLAAFTVLFFLYYKFIVLDWKPPEFFALDDSADTYRITRTYHQNSSKLVEYYLYSLEYSGERSLKDKEGKPLVSKILVGDSSSDLAEYVDIPVTVKGKFVYSDKQCVANHFCIIDGNIARINISSIIKEAP